MTDSGNAAPSAKPMTSSRATSRDRARSGGKDRIDSGTKDQISAGVGGVGGGTALIAIADHLGTRTWPGLLLMYGAPAVAVVAGLIIALLSLWADRTRERSVIKNALKTIDEQIADTKISPEHREYLKKVREEVMVINAEKDVEKVRALKVGR